MIRFSVRIACIIMGIAAAGMVSALCAAPYEDIFPAFNRTTSRVMARHITLPTLANLDYAAYNANPLKYDPQQFRPKAPAKKVNLIDCTFGGLLGSPCTTLDATPLTASEKNMPVAWDALQNRVWKELKNDDFAKAASRINGEKWSDPSIFMPYQELAALYLHHTKTGTQLWVRIEFKPWVKFVRGVLPQGNGGFGTVYGQLSTNAFDSSGLAQAITWIQTSYATRVLNQQEVMDWANELASYWYPKINTDIISLEGETVWPASTTEKDIKKSMSGKTIRNPRIVIRGNPLGTIMYNIFTVDVHSEKPESTVSQTASTVSTHTADTLLSQNYTDNRARFKAELAAHGTYAAWSDETKDIRIRLMHIRDSLPKTQMGFRGADDWVFFKKDIDYINGGDLVQQQPDKNPLPHLLVLNRYLAARNVNLLFVPVPNKSEVYYSSLVSGTALPQGTILNPYGRKFLKDVQDSGLEVIDLLPLFSAAQDSDTQTGVPVYQKQDTHWTIRGLQIAAQAIADRIKAYSWYSQTAQKDSVCYTKKDTVFERLGDIVDKLADSERSAYPPVTQKASQVYLPDGSLYKGSQPQAPVLLMGDSFTGVFELIDCKGAGVGAHIAADTKLPVDIITSWGGGPLVREKMLRARAKNLSAKRVVVYMMVARDLYNYGEGWAPLDTNSVSLHK